MDKILLRILVGALTFSCYLVQLQGLSVPIWKVSVWFPKVTADLDGLGELRGNSPTESCFHLSSNISDIKKKTFHGQKLVDGWLIVGIEGSPSGKKDPKF